MANVGTDYNLNVHIDPIQGLTMDDMDFSCLFFTSSEVKSVKLKKEDMVRIDENNYLAVVCSDKTGPGKLNLKITAYIPDINGIHNGKRKEVLVLDTGEVINK